MLMLLVALVAAGISMWVSDTAMTARLLRIALAVGQHTGVASPGRDVPEPSPCTLALLFMLASAASIGVLATPVGTPPNLIGIALIGELARRDIDFL